MTKKKADTLIAVPVAITTKKDEAEATATVKDLMAELEAPMGMVLVRGDDVKPETKGASQHGYNATYANAWEEMMSRRAKIKQ